MLEHLGCWFHHYQAVLKRVNKLGLKLDYQNRDHIKDTLFAASCICVCHCCLPPTSILTLTGSNDVFQPKDGPLGGQYDE